MQISVTNSCLFRYKQYVKDDILAAIEEVKSGMSALEASRKHGVPYGTLYEKVRNRNQISIKILS